MKKILFIFSLLILTFSSILYSQGNVIVQLRQPPPNQLGAGDLWNLTLDNKSGADMNIKLIGTATEAKDGLIIEGTTKFFTIKPGISNYKHNDFSNAEIKYNNGKYKEVFLRTGNAPVGDYTICVTAFDENGAEVGRENCIIQSVIQLGSITLITLGDGEEIDPEQPVIFTWTPLNDAKEYTLKIVEVKKGQSPESAIEGNLAFFKKDGIRTTLFQYPLSEKKCEIGRRYAWMVMVKTKEKGDIKSDVFCFSSKFINKDSVIHKPRNCCKGFIKNVSQYLDGDLLYITLQAGPQKIKKISAELVYLNAITDNNCNICKNAYWFCGSFVNLNSCSYTINGLNSPAPFLITRELTWENDDTRGIDMQNPLQINIGIWLDYIQTATIPADEMNLCKTNIDYCIKYSFTNDSCVTCDTLICAQITIDGNNQGISIDSNIKYFKKELIRQNSLDINKEQYKTTVQDDTNPIYIKPPTISRNLCDNGGFENGFTDWHEAWSYNLPGTGGGRNCICKIGDQSHCAPWYEYDGFWDVNWDDKKAIKIVTLGVDVDPKVSSLPVVHSGEHAVKLGNDGVNQFQLHEKVNLIAKRFNVDENNRILKFWYALVFQYGYPEHDNYDYTFQPFFTVRVKNNLGVIVHPPSSVPFPISAGPWNPYLHQFEWVRSGALNYIAYYKNWDCAEIDLSQYIGNEVTVEFLMADCSLGDHYGYAYIDDVCIGCDESPSGSCYLTSLTDTCLNLAPNKTVKVIGSLNAPAPINSVEISIESIKLQILHNGLVINTLNNPSNVHVNHFEFNITLSDLPNVTLPPDGYDLVAIVKYRYHFAGSIPHLPGFPDSTAFPSDYYIENYCDYSKYGIKAGKNNDIYRNCYSKICCDDFLTDVKFSVNEVDNIINGNKYELEVNLTAGPKNIKKITADFSSLWASYQYYGETIPQPCNECISNSKLWGNFGLSQPIANSQIQGLSGPFLSVPIGSNSDFSREVTWGKTDGQGINISNKIIKLQLFLPTHSDESVCPDDIKGIIRFKFTDVSCRTCETAINVHIKTDVNKIKAPWINEDY